MRGRERAAVTERSVREGSGGERKMDAGQMVVGHLKRSLGSGLVHTPAVRLFHPATTGVVTIFVLHRFGVSRTGTSPNHLRKSLAYLRRNDYQLLSLEEVVRCFAGEGPPLRKAVAFTVDDGYLDQAAVGAPIFLEFGCPVTIFLTTGFLDGTVVPWWDSVRYAFANTSLHRFQLDLGGTLVSYACSTQEERFQSAKAFLGRAKDVTDAERRVGIENLAVAAEVALPGHPMAPNLPMSWDQARSLERSGVTFGPHTVTHPILSQVSAQAAGHEMADSWRRLGQELDHPVPVFCYPNGRLVDFGAREIKLAKKLGMTGAVTVDEALADFRRPKTDPDDPFRASRVAFPEDHLDTLFCASGLDRVQRRLVASTKRRRA